MHVNKHIPPYQLFQHLKKSEIARFERDYHGDLAPLLIDFDGKLIEIFNTRNDRFAHWQVTSLASLDTSRQDEDELRKQAYNFLVNDVRSLRDLYKEQVGALFDQIAMMKAEFERERAFFVAKADADN
jgi:hypothetical protein